MIHFHYFMPILSLYLKKGLLNTTNVLNLHQQKLLVTFGNMEKKIMLVTKCPKK